MAEQLRDLHGASRSVAYLTLASAPFVLVTALTSNQSGPVLAVIGLFCVGLAVLGGVCWLRPRAISPWFWSAAPAICAVLITATNMLTNDASTGAQLFYLWPVLYAANFLSRKAIYASLIVVAAGGAGTVSKGHSTERWSDWAALVLATTMTAVVVYALRTRADRLRQVLEDQAHTDPLTGLSNRRAFDNDLLRVAPRAQRKQFPLALLTIDLDYFKAINDTWGHTVGDQALQAVAAAMQESAGPEDVVARLGGDEFVMLLKADRARAVAVADALRTAVGEIRDLPGGPPGISIGLAVLPDDATTVEGLITASDAALYAAKTAGRGRTSAAKAQYIEHRADADLPSATQDLPA